MEVKEKSYTWDLTHMYRSIEEWEQDLTSIDKDLKQILDLKNKITHSPANLYQTLSLNDQLSIKLTSIYVYAKMFFDQDMSNSKAKELYEKADFIHNKIQNQLAFLEPELLKLDSNKYKMYVKKMPELKLYTHMFEKLFHRKEHILSGEKEEILSQMDSLGSSFEKIYDDMTVNDIQYPEVKDRRGKVVIANNANYYKALTNSDRTLRKNFFKGLLGTYGKYINSITSAYYGTVKHSVFSAKTRNYESSREMIISENFIPEDVYKNLLKTVRENCTPLQDYIAFRKKYLKLKDIHFYDLFVPIISNVNKTYTYEEAQEIVLEALAVLGEDYTDILREAFTDRWIDVYPGNNKVSGAYAIEAYGHHPYSLLNFTGTLGDIFTIAHELGHVMHSYYSSQNQPYVYSDYTIFCAEVASTVNEQLLFNYLLHKSSSSKEKAMLLSNQLDNIRSTLYRQTLFADFEYQAHSMVEQEKPLLPTELCNLHKKLYEIYHGKNFVIDEELSFEWARIPHFYRSFYVYQYATGISAAISISNKLLNEGDTAIKNYRKFLTTGGSSYSIELLKIAGVDMTSPKPILDAIQNFQDTLEELKINI